MKRRNKIVALSAPIAFLASLFSCSASASTAYTVATAPDKPSQTVLSRALSQLDQGRASESEQDVEAAVHANFTQIIDQNFARLDAAGAQALIDGLSDQELHDLAQYYVAENKHRKGLLLAILAYRLDGQHLGRISQWFGYSPVYKAVQRYSPSKLNDLSLNTHDWYTGPSMGVSTMAAPNIDMTPYEIYLDFRTSPVGALTVPAALWEAGVFIGTRITGAFAVGYSVGQGFDQVVQTYDLPLWDSIGNSINSMMNSIATAYTVTLQGQYEDGAGYSFGIGSQATADESGYGGDYDVGQSWVIFNTPTLVPVKNKR